MRAPDQIDQRDIMLAQMADAFMARDDARYLEAVAWLRDYCDGMQHQRGRIKIGVHWFDPAVYDSWVKSLRQTRQAK